MTADPQSAPDRADRILTAAQEYAHATADQARPELFRALTFLLAQVRNRLALDVVFVSRFVNQERVFEVVSAEGEATSLVAPGNSDPLLDAYCQSIVDGRLPAVIADTSALNEAASLAITNALAIRAYLSAPVLLPNGRVFGTVCCISHQVRPDLRERDAIALRAVAKAVAASITPGGTIRYASWTAPTPLPR